MSEPPFFDGPDFFDHKPGKIIWPRVLFVSGVAGVLGAYFARNDAQSESETGLVSGRGFSAHWGPYPQIDSSGYYAFAFVAGAIALLGLGRIIAGLVRSK